MNVLFITGNLTKDPELHSTQDGKTVCNFSVAVNRRQKNSNGQSEADFFRVAVWGNQAESCQKYLAKGRKVAVTGSVSVHTYTGNDGTTKAQMEVMANNVEFLGKAEEGQNTQGQSAQAPAPAPGGFTPVESDGLPF